ncbi:hypothetical protein HUW46_06912 [Amycolatopsis sp. CA-230715]|nr:hypothetical protein HUW46_06912 [Amycolatopsis sp. CA-230715]
MVPNSYAHLVIERRKKDIWWFLVLAYGGAWLCMMPLWLSGFRRESTAVADGFGVQASIWAMMLMPALAAVAVLLRGGNRPRELPGLLGMTAAGGARGLLGWCSFAFAATVLAVFASAALSAFAGTFEFDFAGFPGRADFAGWAIGLVVTIPLFLGEELGWQGYLLPRLLPFGTRPALLVMGLVWGAWHLPTVLLGGQFPGHSAWLAVPAMLVAGCLIGVFIGWIRLRTGSVWPTVTAHAVISNLAPSLLGALGKPGQVVDPLHTGPIGWTGWVVFGVIAAVLSVRGVAPARHA